MTSETLEMIKLRDAAKKKFELLAKNPSQLSLLEKEQSWEEYRKLRNKVNNLKKQNEIKYNKLGLSLAKLSNLISNLGFAWFLLLKTG